MSCGGHPEIICKCMAMLRCFWGFCQKINPYLSQHTLGPNHMLPVSHSLEGFQWEGQSGGGLDFEGDCRGAWILGWCLPDAHAPGYQFQGQMKPRSRSLARHRRSMAQGPLEFLLSRQVTGQGSPADSSSRPPKMKLLPVKAERTCVLCGNITPTHPLDMCTCITEDRIRMFLFRRLAPTQ